jgi:hypothetical protein
MNDSDYHRTTELVEDALKTYPLAPVPASLQTRVMIRVRPAAIVPRFSFPWLETAIGLICSTLLTMAVTLLLEIPPVAASHLENSVRIFLLQPGLQSVVLAVASSVALSCVCFVLALNLFRKPFNPRLISRH